MTIESTEFNDGYLEMQIDPPDLSITRLEKLFWEGMSISNTLGRKSSYYSPSAATAEDIEEEPVPFKYSISQHYTHSSHVMPALHPLQPSKQDIASRLLIKNGIPPSALLRSQLTLFEQAEDEQRSRLIELWRIFPPTYAKNGGQKLADSVDEYQTTTLAKQEELAWLSYQSAVGSQVSSRNIDDVEKASNQSSQLPMTQQNSVIIDQFSSNSTNSFGYSSQQPADIQRNQTSYRLPVHHDRDDEEML